MINFKVNKLEQTRTEGKFVLEPLEKGFGHTLGNVLRRVMLSSLDGYAINSVKIDGVSHQFSTISGISEDVIEIILNLKKVRVILYSEKSAKFSLNFSGKGEVKASDIDTNGLGEIINPDQHIASVNDPKTKLKMEIGVGCGVGYEMSDEKKNSELGIIPVDALYSPVIRVDYSVDATRVGRSSDYDKLELHIATDGSLFPEEALIRAARLMSAYFKQIYDPTLDIEVVADTPSISDEILKMTIEELDLPVRITNALKAVEIDNIEKLISTPKSTLMKAKNLGSQSLVLISEKLLERGLTLSEA